ncbi:XRE family transcriptional regulator [Sphaerisporangium sp. NPDC049003]|uniref:XRE family transcriptional regulator n=1 Tax=Sphaerisporangium sp. NPDC049003 TaxID=3364517 RepID=UPI00371F3DF6
MARQLADAADEHTRARMPGRDSLVRMIKFWEAGRHRPKDPYRVLYCRAFGLSEADLFGVVEMPLPALVLPSLAPDSDLYERITRAIGERQRVDSETIDWLERCLSQHRQAEDTLGSRPVLPVVRAQLSAVSDLARGASGALGDRMVGMAAQYAQFMAWLCQDSGDLAAALAWYDRSHGWALESGDAALAATTLNMRAHLSWSVGDAQRCVRLADASRWHDGRTTLGVQGMAAQMAARGLAQMKDAPGARTLLGEAEESIKRAAEQPEDEPPWMYFYDDGWFTMQRGMAELELGEGARSAALEATAWDSSTSALRELLIRGCVVALGALVETRSEHGEIAVYDHAAGCSSLARRYGRRSAWGDMAPSGQAVALSHGASTASDGTRQLALIQRSVPTGRIAR